MQGKLKNKHTVNHAWVFRRLSDIFKWPLEARLDGSLGIYFQIFKTFGYEKLKNSDRLLPVFNNYFSTDSGIYAPCLPSPKPDIYNRISNLVKAQRHIGIDKNKNWGGEGGGLVGRAAGGTI